MSWLAANDFFGIELAARDRVDDLTHSAADQIGTRVVALGSSDDASAHMDCTLWMRALGLCPSEAR